MRGGRASRAAGPGVPAAAAAPARGCERSPSRAAEHLGTPRAPGPCPPAATAPRQPRLSREICQRQRDSRLLGHGQRVIAPCIVSSEARLLETLTPPPVGRPGSALQRRSWGDTRHPVVGVCRHQRAGGPSPGPSSPPGVPPRRLPCRLTPCNAEVQHRWLVAETPCSRRARQGLRLGGGGTGGRRGAASQASCLAVWRRGGGGGRGRHRDKVLTDRRGHAVPELGLLGPGGPEAPLGSSSIRAAPRTLRAAHRGRLPGPRGAHTGGPRPPQAPPLCHRVTAGGRQKRSCLVCSPQAQGWEVGCQGWWGYRGEAPRPGCPGGAPSHPSWETLGGSPQGPPGPSPSPGPGVAGPGGLLGGTCLGVRRRGDPYPFSRGLGRSQGVRPWPQATGAPGPSEQPDVWGQQGSARPPALPRPAAGPRARPGQSVDVLWTRTLAPRWLPSTSLPPARQGCPQGRGQPHASSKPGPVRPGS